MTYPTVCSLVHVHFHLTRILYQVRHTRIVQYMRVWWWEYGLHPTTIMVASQNTKKTVKIVQRASLQACLENYIVIPMGLADLHHGSSKLETWGSGAVEFYVISRYTQWQSVMPMTWTQLPVFFHRTIPLSLQTTGHKTIQKERLEKRAHSTNSLCTRWLRRSIATFLCHSLTGWLLLDIMAPGPAMGAFLSPPTKTRQ